MRRIEAGSYTSSRHFPASIFKCISLCGSIEGLLNLFKGKGKEKQKKISKRGRKNSSHEIEKQLTIRAELRTKRGIKG